MFSCRNALNGLAKVLSTLPITLPPLELARDPMVLLVGSMSIRERLKLPLPMIRGRSSSCASKKQTCSDLPGSSAK